MKIITKNLAELHPYENNPRFNDEAVVYVAESIKQFGFKVPLVIDCNNVIVTGHTRYKAAERLGITEVPCIQADDLSPEQIKAYRLADNKVAEYSKWDLSKLERELADISIDMDLLGFDKLVAEGVESLDDIQEDDVPEPEPDPITQPGDIWQLGPHRLICGDSAEVGVISKLLAGKQADMWLTDPPYNVDYQGCTDDKLKIKNDNMSDGKFYTFLFDAFHAALSGIKPGGAFYIWHADTEGYNFRKACRDNKMQIRECLIWVKNALVLGRQDYQWRHEPCLYGWKEGAAHYFADTRMEDTVIDDKVNVARLSKEELKKLCSSLLAVGAETTILYEDKPARSAAHPTMKPVKLFARLVRNSSKPGEIVLDTFGGSGTTIIACEQLGRIGYSVELDPKYCDVIVKRWENFTGSKAVRNGK